MNQYLMCSYGAAKIVDEKPQQAIYLDTVAVNSNERYRVLQEGKEVFAVLIQ